MTALKTVKYFRDLGLELVADDMISSQTSVEHSPACLLGECVPNGCEPNLSARDAWVIRGFAWRENTGEKPSFTGEIEVELCHKSVEPRVTGNFNWSIGEYYSIKRWRPLLSQQDEVKTVIDWSVAPETDGECCYVESLLNSIPCGFYEDRKPKMFLRADVAGNKKDHGYLFRSDDYSDKITITRRPQPTPEYTQEMADNGELPIVGVQCIGTSSRGGIMTSWRKGSITFTSPTYTIFKTNNGIEFCCNHLLGQDFTFKPLTPLVTLEDGKAYQFDIKERYGDTKKIQGIYSDNLRVFQSVGNAFAESTVTNIQPLTVETKS